jgi:predicted O-methyltransferase YrrM
VSDENPLFAQVDAYIDELFIGNDPVLQGVERSLVEARLPQISVSPSQGKFLYLLARLIKARRILELGTLAGYSTIWLARALPADGQLITIEYDPNHAEVARNNIAQAGFQDRVELRVGRALDVLPELQTEDAGPFDFIFIDADKQPYAEYFEWALKLARPGSLIIADNVVRDGKVLDADSSDELVRGVRRFNSALAANKDVSAVILQLVGVKHHDGMAFAIVNG